MHCHSPQDKKRLSYERDRRNAFGENSKSSRKNISRQKAIVNRQNRREVSRQLWQMDVETGESERRLRAPKRWHKRADVPLKQHVFMRLERRVRLGMIERTTADHAQSRILAHVRRDGL